MYPYIYPPDSQESNEDAVHMASNYPPPTFEDAKILLLVEIYFSILIGI